MHDRLTQRQRALVALRKDRLRLLLPLAAFGADLATILLCTALAVLLRPHLPYLGDAKDVLRFVLPISGLLVAFWLILLVIMGAYRTRHFGAGTSEYRTVLQSSMLAAGMIGVSAYLFQYPLSRGFFFLLFLLGLPALVLERYLMRRGLHAARRSGKLRLPMLIAGDPAHIDQLAEVLHRESWVGYDLVGALMYTGDAKLKSGIPVFGAPDDAVAAIQQTNASAVIFVEGSFRRAHHFNHLARSLENENAHLIVVPSLTEISSNRVDVQTVAGVPLLTVDKPQAERAGHGLKRTFDLAAAAVILLLLSPLMLATAIAVKAGDGGPILFRQPRVGRRGEVFNCLKFRSMVVNADEIKRRMMAENEGAGPLFKMKDDPRITKVGRFIRRYSIDELPQLWNVVIGDMSLVGPRPALQSEVDQYKAHVLRRLDVRPGITGLWQVSGRSDLSWDDTVRLDLYYVDNWSFTQDLSILIRTVHAVFSSSGAY